MTIALSRWCELAQHNNLLSIVHSRHLIPPLQYGTTLFTTQSAGRCSCSCYTCLHHLDEGVGTRMQGSLGWLLLLDAAHRAQSNSVLTPSCAMCFHEMCLTEANSSTSMRQENEALGTDELGKQMRNNRDVEQLHALYGVRTRGGGPQK